MIITKFVNVRVINHSLEHYKNLGYSVKYNDVIEIPVSHLSKGSQIRIKVRCDIKMCGKEKNITYQKYLKNIKKYDIYTCSQKCGFFKCKQTCLGNNGVEYPMQSPEIYRKIKQTKLKNHGNENYNNREQSKETCIEKYGVEHPMMLDETKEKSKQTCLENFGVEWAQQSPKIRERSSQTKLKNHGDENFNNPEKTKETKLINHGDSGYNNRNQTLKTCLELYGDPYYNNVEQINKTNLELYGVKFPFQSNKIQQKCRQTCFKNNGVENPFQIPEIINRIFEIKFGKSYDEYLEQLPDFIRYKKEVHKFTRKQPSYLLNNFNKRGLSGVHGSYHLDHKFTMYQGFKDNVCPYIVGNIINLEMLPYKDNISKNYKCSMIKEELFEKYDNRDKILEQLKKNYNK